MFSDSQTDSPTPAGRCHTQGRLRLLWAVVAVSVMLVMSTRGALAQVAALPKDPRLSPIQTQLAVQIEQAQKAGLPAALLVRKVNEGLAKGVPADRIVSAVVRLREALARARTHLSDKGYASPSADLIRSLAEATFFGIPIEASDKVIGRATDADVSDAARMQGLEILVDLSLRGYPVDRSTALVRDALVRDQAGLARLPQGLDVIRRDFALTHAESVDALTLGLSATGSLSRGIARASADESRRGTARGFGQGRGREGSPSQDRDPPGLGAGRVPPGQVGRDKMPPAGPKK